MLLSYHRHLKVISETLDESGRVGHGYGGLYECDAKPGGVGRISGDAGAFPESEMIH